MLLKMMSRPRDAIVSHKIVYSKSYTNYDKSASLSMEADALVTLGNTKKAIEKYKKALGLTNYQLTIYLPLSECYKEIEISKKKWLDFLILMEDSVDYSVNLNRYSDDYKEILKDQKNSLLYYDDINVEKDPKSDVYWAMYTAAERSKDTLVIRYYLPL